MRPTAALAGLLCGTVVALQAGADVPPQLVGTTVQPSSARGIDGWNRVYVEGSVIGVDGRPYGEIQRPPHPLGTRIALPCDAFGDCFHEVHVAEGLGASGRILGRQVFFGSGGPFIPFATTWNPSGTGTTTLGGELSRVTDGSASDLFVGRAQKPGSFGFEIPAYWDGPTGTLVELANLGYFTTEKGPFPGRVDDAGEIVGTSEGSGRRAAIWQPPGYALVFLPMLPGGATSAALDIGAGGIVVGSADAGGGSEVAVAWLPNGGGWDVTTLDPPGAGGSCAEATAINAAGDVAGNCTTAGGAARGVVWPWSGSGWGEAVVLAPRPGDLESAVYALNDHPLAAGRSGGAADGLAVLWNLGDPIATVPALAAPALAWLAAACAASGWLALRLRQGRGRTRTCGGSSGGSPST